MYAVYFTVVDTWATVWWCAFTKSCAADCWSLHAVRSRARMVFGTHEKRKHPFAWVWGEIARVLQHQNNKYTFCKHTIPPQYGLKYAFWPCICPIFHSGRHMGDGVVVCFHKKLCSRFLEPALIGERDKRERTRHKELRQACASLAFKNRCIPPPNTIYDGTVDRDKFGQISDQVSK